jgi:hypothetical protein
MPRPPDPDYPHHNKKKIVVLVVVSLIMLLLAALVATGPRPGRSPSARSAQATTLASGAPLSMSGVVRVAGPRFG